MFPSPVYGGGGAVIRDGWGEPQCKCLQAKGHDLMSDRAMRLPTPPSPYDGATSPVDGGG